MQSTQPLVDPVVTEVVSSDLPPESRSEGLRADIAYGARLIASYLRSDLVIGVALLAMKFGLEAGSSMVMLKAQLQLAEVTNALVERKTDIVPPLLSVILLLGVCVIAFSLLRDFSSYTLRMRARQHLTDRITDRWMAKDRFYHLERYRKVDHPEQRIQEDIYAFVENVLSMGPTIFGAVFSITLYARELWRLSPPLTVSLFGTELVVHGSFFFAVCAFAFGWTLVTHWLGRGLTRAEIVRQRLEAQFREDMAGIRENGEAIAFEKGTRIECQRLNGTFGLIRRNWLLYTIANMRVTLASSVPTVVLLAAPMLMCAPYIMKGQMQMGDLQMVTGSMMMVYNSAGIFIILYRGLAMLRSAVSRLHFFDRQLDSLPAPSIQVTPADGGTIRTRDLALAYPDGRPMLRVADLAIAPGDRLLIKGPSGAGKSTLLRALSGLWPHGGGQVQAPDHVRCCFLPQRSYMPDGTLASLIAYPAAPDSIPDAVYAEILGRLNLAALVPRLHEFAPWRRILSPGEQQRIACARAILSGADFVFLDESTSALDMHAETSFYTLLDERLPKAAIISVAHRSTVERFHNQIAEVTAGQLVLQPSPPSVDPASRPSQEGITHVIDR
ncbi:SbmA/BacA-like family transporter [Niveispirillum sp. BGYR6]|uniref:ABC transporter ATP-binding protein/permease n=1 Tax=Niveispirillum sp. BGYR6 TaxID=2971249 RepID=UPI0022B9CB8D|nr:SbmA/BacA-like family transporter [Niveispirillum sp. BGYR6]MDG5497531.1 SbmA/BacA-like family transporter [Niveispirillum sp. BGYR6]